MKINNAYVLHDRIFVPVSEQKRIASFFTILDKKIAELKQRKRLLEQYKKGIVQKLFSQDLRFNDDNGKEFPKWQKLSFGKLYSFKTTNSFSRDKFNFENGTVKNIHYGDLIQGIKRYLIFQKKPFHT